MLETCGKDAVAIARCFVSQKDGFAIYSDYCTNYPKYVSCSCCQQFHNETTRLAKLLQKIAVNATYNFIHREK